MNAVVRQLRPDVLVPPQSIDAEQSVLGGLMMDPKAFAKINLIEDDFYRRDHALIFRAISELDSMGKPHDAVTLGEWFDSKGLIEEVAGGSYLIELATTTPSAANIKSYAEIVKSKAVFRRIIEIGTQAVNDGFRPDGRHHDEVVDHIVRELMALSAAEQKHDFTMRQAVGLAFEDASQAFFSGGKMRGIPTGFPTIDQRFGGFHPSDLIFIGARPSMGKTTLMGNMAQAGAMADYAVGMISGEQSALQIGQRAVASEARVNAECLRSGKIEDTDWPKLNQAVAKLKERNIFIYDKSAPTLDEVCRTARRWVQEHGIKVIYIDYLQRVRYPKAQNRIDEVSEVARGLKTLARDLNIPVVCLAQVKAEVDKRNDKRPGLGDIANSDEATREADQIMFLYREDVYSDNEATRNLAELNVEKNRHGPTGKMNLLFHPEQMRFVELDKNGVDYE